jgi:hypothetical protein
MDRVRRFGRRFTGDGHGVGARKPSPLVAAGRRLAAAAVVLAVLVPLALPRMTTGLLQRFRPDAASAGIGFGPARDGMRVDLFSALAVSSTRTRTSRWTWSRSRRALVPTGSGVTNLAVGRD